MYGVIDGILGDDRIKARLYDEGNHHEFFDEAIITKSAFSEKDWCDIISAPEAGFIFLMINNKCILRRKT